MANAKTAPNDADLKTGSLPAKEQKPGGSAPEENLEDLEAFLDDFEKGLDAEASRQGRADPAADASAKAGVEAPEPPFLSDDQIHLSGRREPAVPPSPPPAAPGFEPEPLPSKPLDVPAFIHAAANPPPTKPLPTVAAGFSRIGFILALVLGGAALLVAIGAGLMALNANRSLQAMESRLGAGGPAGGADPRVATLQGEVKALRLKMDEVAKALEGPVGRMAESYPQEIDKLQSRLAALEGPGAPASVAGTPAAAPSKSEAPAAKPPAQALSTKAPGAEATAPRAEAAKEAAKGPAPASGATGGWVVYLVSSDERKRAETQLAQARAAGMTADITSTRIGGKTWYRVTVPGFATAEEARDFAGKTAAQAGFGAAWIGSR